MKLVAQIIFTHAAKTIMRRHNWCAESMWLCKRIAKIQPNQANPLGSGGVRHAFCPQYTSDTSGQLLFYHIIIFISSVSRWFNDLSLNFYCVFTMSLVVKHFVKYIFWAKITLRLLDFLLNLCFTGNILLVKNNFLMFHVKHITPKIWQFCW